MHMTEISLSIPSSATSTTIALSAVSAQGPVIARPATHPAGVPVKCLITPDVICWIRRGVNPTALADGTDLKLLAGNTYRAELLDGERIAVIAAGAGTCSFTPEV